MKDIAKIIQDDPENALQNIYRDPKVNYMLLSPAGGKIRQYIKEMQAFQNAMPKQKEYKLLKTDWSDHPGVSPQLGSKYASCCSFFNNKMILKRQSKINQLLLQLNGVGTGKSLAYAILDKAFGAFNMRKDHGWFGDGYVPGKAGFIGADSLVAVNGEFPFTRSSIESLTAGYKTNLPQRGKACVQTQREPIFCTIQYDLHTQGFFKDDPKAMEMIMARTCYVWFDTDNGETLIPLCEYMMEQWDIKYPFGGKSHTRAELGLTNFLPPDPVYDQFAHLNDEGKDDLLDDSCSHDEQKQASENDDDLDLGGITVASQYLWNDSDDEAINKMIKLQELEGRVNHSKNMVHQIISRFENRNTNAWRLQSKQEQAQLMQVVDYLREMKNLDACYFNNFLQNNEWANRVKIAYDNDVFGQNWSAFDSDDDMHDAN